jgi:hypothetical protein
MGGFFLFEPDSFKDDFPIFAVIGTLAFFRAGLLPFFDGLNEDVEGSHTVPSCAFQP